MGLTGIIAIIISILQFVAGLFGPKKMDTMAFIADYDCARVEWVGAPAVVDGEFMGTAEVRCHFEGSNAGGIAALRAHMVEQLPKDGDIQGAARVASYQGLPSLGFRTHLVMGDATAYGMTHIASDGDWLLRNVFESHSIEASGNGKYVKQISAETQIAALGGREYELTMVHSLRVQKPFGATASSFKKSLMEQAAESLAERAVSAVHEMASHL